MCACLRACGRACVYPYSRIYVTACGDSTVSIYVYIGECVCVLACVLAFVRACGRACVYPYSRIYVTACGPIGTKFGTHMQIHLQRVVG